MPTAESSQSDLRLPRRERVRRRSEFLHIQAARQQVRDGLLRIGYRQREDQGPPRLGLAVSRRVGNAVARNRVKRVLRAIYREHKDLVPKGLDLVIIPLNGKKAARSDLSRASFIALMRKLNGRLSS